MLPVPQTCWVGGFDGRGQPALGEGEDGALYRKRELRLLGSAAQTVAGMLLTGAAVMVLLKHLDAVTSPFALDYREEIGRASCRERV